MSSHPKDKHLEHCESGAVPPSYIYPSYCLDHDDVALKNFAK